MKEFKIKEISYLDNGVGINYGGQINNDLINLDEIYHLIKKAVFHKKYHNLLEWSKTVCTILKDFDSKYLDLCHFSKDKLEFCRYINGKLQLYEVKDKDVEVGEFRVKYTKAGIKFVYNNSFDCINSSCVNSFSNQISKLNDYVRDLATVKAYSFNIEDEKLVLLYQKFYNENPNFTKRDINIKMQTMLSILAGFNVTTTFSSFTSFSHKEMPLSLELKKEVDRLFPFGEVKNVNSKLKDEISLIVSSIGTEIKNGSSNNDLEKVLINLSKVMFLNRYFTDNFDVDKMVNDFRLDLDEVASSVSLVKKIRKRIDFKE